MYLAFRALLEAALAGADIEPALGGAGRRVHGVDTRSTLFSGTRT